jgi:hypothetical protein
MADEPDDDDDMSIVPDPDDDEPLMLRISELHEPFGLDCYIRIHPDSQPLPVGETDQVQKYRVEALVDYSLDALDEECHKVAVILDTKGGRRLTLMLSLEEAHDLGLVLAAAEVMMHQEEKRQKAIEARYRTKHQDN